MFTLSELLFNKMSDKDGKKTPKTESPAPGELKTPSHLLHLVPSPSLIQPISPNFPIHPPIHPSIHH